MKYLLIIPLLLTISCASGAVRLNAINEHSRAVTSLEDISKALDTATTLNLISKSDRQIIAKEYMLKAIDLEISINTELRTISKGKMTETLNFKFAQFSLVLQHLNTDYVMKMSVSHSKTELTNLINSLIVSMNSWQSSLR